MAFARTWLSTKNVFLFFMALVLALLGYLSYLRYEGWLVGNSKKLVDETLTIYKEAEENILTSRLSLIGGLEKFVMSRNDQEILKDFPIYAAGLQNDFEGVRNVGVAKGGVLSLIYPVRGNEQAIGYNYLTDKTPSVKADISRAIQSGKSVVSDPFQLRQGGLGIAVRKAIFKNNRLWGFVSTVADVPSTLSYAGLEKGKEKFDMALRDRNRNVFWGDEEVFKRGSVTMKIEFDDTYWELGGVPNGGWNKSVSESTGIFAMAGISLIVILMILANTLWIQWETYIKKNIQWGGTVEAAKPALLYLLLGVIWILFSDNLVGFLVTDPDLYIEISIIKGWAFVIITALLLFVWTAKSFGKLETLLSLLNKAQKVANFGYYVLDIETGIWEGSDDLKTLFGIDQDYKTDIAGWLNLVAPDQKKDMSNYFAKEVVGKKKPFDKEYRIVNKKSGKEIWVHGMGRLDFDYNGVPIRMVGTIQNITQRKKNEVQLAKLNAAVLTEKQKLESILRDIGDAVFVTDTHKNIIMANKAMERLFGLTEIDMVGKNIEEILDMSYESSGKRPDDLIKTVFEKKVPIRPIETLILNKKDGMKVSVDGVATPVTDMHKKLVGTVWVFRDVTKEKELEKMRVDFVSLASHQLRSPLTGIKWFVRLLLKDVLTPKQKKIREYVEKIGESNERLISLVNDLLMTSKVGETKYDKVTFKKVDIKELLVEILKQMERSMIDKNISPIGLDNIPVGLTVDGNRIKLFQVFANLLENAVNYSPNKSKIEIKAEKTRSELTVSVSDKGIGIPKRQRDKVFEKFFRADNVADISPGSGLGLYLTKNIIESHGGKVWFDSEEGKGTTFFVKLPIKKKNG